MQSLIITWASQALIVMMFECKNKKRKRKQKDLQCLWKNSKRLLALATQKFIADIATDAFQHCKVRQSGNRKTGKVNKIINQLGWLYWFTCIQERKTVLTMEDLSPALAEYGVNVKKPEYYS